MSAGAPAGKRTTGDVLRALRRPKVLAMLLLGFSSGLPLYLVGNTMGYWMREGGSELSAIGFLSWVGLAYTLKFLWAPIIDKTDVPLLGRLGRRRGWMVLSQLIVAAALAGMAIVQPQGGLVLFGAMALVAAFASATQDIVVDAWRIEIADDTEELGLLTSGTQIGYRSALLVTDALILIMATYIGWAPSYWVMAALMGVGVLAALFLAREPAASQAPEVAGHAPLWTVSGLWDAIVGPFLTFFRTHGKWALLMLAAISLYRLPDFVMGPMNNPFYADIGISKEFVGEVRASIGLAAALGGIAAAGISAVRFGFIPTLLAGAILGPGSNAAFAWVAYTSGDPTVFIAAMAIDGSVTPKVIDCPNPQSGKTEVAAVATQRVTPADVALSFLPLSHILQRMGDYLFFATGTCIAYVDSFDLVPLGPTVMAGPIFWAMEDSPEVLRFYRDWVADAPDERRADDEPDAHRNHPDHDRGARAHQQQRHDVAPIRVGAQPVRRIGRQQLGRHIHFIGRVRRPDQRQRRCDDYEQGESGADGEAAVAQRAAPPVVGRGREGR